MVLKNIVGRCYKRRVEGKLNIIGSCIKLPEAKEEVKAVVTEFYRQHGFSQCLGAVDGTHISVKRPKRHDLCRLKFNKSKLQRAEKQKAISQDSTIANVGKKLTHRSKQQLPIYKLKLVSVCAKQQHFNLAFVFANVLSNYKMNHY